MKVNLVTVNSGWILSKIAERMAANAPDGVEFHVSHQPRPGYEYYYYCDIQNCYHGYKQFLPGATHVGYITHAHEDDPKWLKEMFNNQGVWDLDGIKSMNRRYTNMCEDIGWEKPIWTVTPPADAEHFRLGKIKIVIANRGGFPGYGHDFMLALPDDYSALMKKFRFVFLGNGWEPVVEKYKSAGIGTIHEGDDVLTYPGDYEEWYHRADYLLVPILWTAGPYCSMEAHLCGLPIIASDVGLIDYEVKPEYMYPPGDTKALMDILRQIHHDKELKRMDIIKNIGSWRSYTQEITNFIRRCRHG